jgi:hypothetical protein
MAGDSRSLETSAVHQWRIDAEGYALGRPGGVQRQGDSVSSIKPG